MKMKMRNKRNVSLRREKKKQKKSKRARMIRFIIISVVKIYLCDNNENEGNEKIIVTISMIFFVALNVIDTKNYFNYLPR